MMGTAIAQLITFASSPLLTRLFSPSDYAAFAIFFSLNSTISVVASARYNLAIPLPEKDADAINLLQLSVLIAVFVSLLSLLGIVVYSFCFSYKSEYFSNWFYLLPVSIFSWGSYSVFNYWSTRNKTYTNNSIGRITSAIVTALVSIIAGYLCMDTKGLIIGLVCGQTFAFLFLLITSLKNNNKLFSKFDWEKIKSVAYKYKSFLSVNSPHALVDSLQANGIVFLLSYYFFDAVVSWYFLAFRILKAPVYLIGSAFAQVFYQRVAVAKNKGENPQALILNIYKKLFLIGLPGFFILFLFTPQIFSFVYGNKWTAAGEIAQILIPWLFLNFIISPVSGLPLIYNKQKQAFILTIIDLSLRILALIIGGMYGSYKLSFLIISIFCSGLALFTMWWYYSLAVPENELQKHELE